MLAAALFALATACPQGPGFSDLAPGFGLGSTPDWSFCADVGDVDGDGDPDLVVGNGTLLGDLTQARDRLYRNQGGLLVYDPTALPPDSAHTRRIRLFDCDGDGDLDVVAADTQTFGPDTPRLLINNGSGVFQDQSAARGFGGLVGARELEIADFDRDGDPDVVVAGIGQSWFYRNNGSGVFQQQGGRLPTFAGPTASAAADVDRDGDVDLVLADFVFAPVKYLLRNDGTGTFTTDLFGLAPNRSWHTVGMRFADLDGDGFPELVCANRLFPLELFHNVGGRLVPYPNDGLPRDNRYCTDVDTVDVDGDGDRDLLFVAPDARPLLFVNQSGGTFAAAPAATFAPSIRSAEALRVADFDGDGIPDAVHVGAERDGVWFGSGSGLSEAATEVPNGRVLASIGPPATLAGDLDGDLDIDVLSYTTLFRRAPDGAFRPEPIFGSFPPTPLALGDVDHDGDLDALVYGYGVQWLLNDGTGQFAATPHLGITVVDPRYLFAQVADLDGDQQLDVVATTWQNLSFAWNNGSSSATVATIATGPGLNQQSNRIAIGDVDGDLDLDVVTDDPWTLYMNQGNRTFVPAALPSGAGLGVDLGDVDGDGDLDLVFGTEWRTTTARLLRNAGNGTFAIDAGAMTFGGLRLPELVDVDLDGDLDLLGLFGTVLVNSGPGTFGAPVAYCAGLDTLDHTVADLDLDGDPDDIMAGNFGCVVLQNLARHVAVARPLAFGQSRSITVANAGAPLPGAAIVFGALAPAPALLPVPPIGLLALPPQATIALGFLIYSPAETRLTLPLQLPPTGAFGSTVFAQAAVLRGSDPLASRFTGLGTFPVVR